MTSKGKCALAHVLKFVSVIGMVISTKPDGSFETDNGSTYTASCFMVNVEHQ